MTLSRFIPAFTFALFGMFVLPMTAFADAADDYYAECSSQRALADLGCNSQADPEFCHEVAFDAYNECIASYVPAPSVPEATPTPTTPVPVPPSSFNNILSQGIIFAGICSGPAPAEGDDSCTCRATGTCTIDNILQVFVNVSVFILGISGSLVLLMFIYGGIMWLTSAGNEARVTKGKDILAGSAIGLAIIFGAYVAISVIISALKTGDLPTEG